MTEQRDDKEFEAFLAGESGLADRYRELGSEEPPTQLDARILAKARNAAKIRRLEFGPRGGWLKPVALAATVLLSFSLVMNIVMESPVRYEQVITASKEFSVVPEDASEGASYDKVAPNVPRQPETKRMMTEQPSATAIEEIAVMARSKSADLKDVPMAVSVLQPEAQGIDQDAALLFVARYVAATQTAAVAGRAPAQARERQAASRTDAVRPAMPGSALVGQDFASSGELPSGDDPESMLRDIVQLDASGSSAVAGTRLDEFLARYPDHPVSVKIREQGY